MKIHILPVTYDEKTKSDIWTEFKIYELINFQV